MSAERTYDGLMKDLRQMWAEADERQRRDMRRQAVSIDGGCPNGPDPETGEWPCDPKGYFGAAECQVCGRVGEWKTKREGADPGVR